MKTNFKNLIVLSFVIFGFIFGQFAVAASPPKSTSLPPLPDFSSGPRGLPERPAVVPQIPSPAFDPDNGFIEGKVVSADTKEPIGNARIIIPELGKSLKSDAQGNFKFEPLAVKDKKEGDYVTLKVISPGFGEHTMVDVGVYPGNTATVTLELKKGDKPTKWWGVMRPEERRRKPPEPAPSPDEGTITALYSSQTVPPPQIRVAIREPNPLTGKPNRYGKVIATTTVDFDFYVKHVLPQEWLPYWQAPESFKAGAMAVKNYGWYWINRGGKYQTSYGADVDNSINTQVYNPNVSYSSTDKAVDDMAANGWYQNGVIFEPQYRGETPYSASSSCGFNCMTQEGSWYWADKGKDYKWILNYYYEPDPTYFTIKPQRPKLYASSVSSNSITLNFSSPSAFWYQVNKWANGTWNNIVYFGPNKTFTDTNLTSNTQYFYMAAAYNSAGWSTWAFNNGHMRASTITSSRPAPPITDPYFIAKDQIGLKAKSPIQSPYSNTTVYGMYKAVVGGSWRLVYLDLPPLLDPSCMKIINNKCYPINADQQLPNPYVDKRDLTFYYFDKNLTPSTAYYYAIGASDPIKGGSEFTNYNGYVLAVTQSAN